MVFTRIGRAACVNLQAVLSIAAAAPGRAHADDYRSTVNEAVREFAAGSFAEARTLLARMHAWYAWMKGDHVLAASAPGHRSRDLTVTISGGRTSASTWCCRCSSWPGARQPESRCAQSDRQRVRRPSISLAHAHDPAVRQHSRLQHPSVCTHPHWVTERPRSWRDGPRALSCPRQGPLN